MKKRPKSKYAKDLRTPKYKLQIIADKRKKADAAHWNKILEDIFERIVKRAFDE